MDTTPEQFIAVLSGCSGFVLYERVLTEVDFQTISAFSSVRDSSTFVVPFTKESDPYAMALECQNLFKNSPVAILIPGQRFDTHGTRHGRGGGWYDRFLSQVPPEWLRVGVLKKEQLSDDTLTREVWDQPVDWLVVIDGAFWWAYETGARR